MPESNGQTPQPGDLPNPNRQGIPEKLKAQIEEEDRFIAQTFQTQAGQKCLDWFKKEYVEGSPFRYVVDGRGAINAEASVHQLFVKEGKRELVKNIEMRMKRANNK